MMAGNKISHTLFLFLGVVLASMLLSQLAQAQTQELGEPYQLSGEMVLFGDVNGFRVEISPDGKYVVYTADQETDEVDEMYSVPIGGGTPIKLNGPIVSGVSGFRGVVDFKISTDSTRVVYRAAQEASAKQELYTVPITGGTAGKLNPALARGSVGSYDISADSAYVVYIAEQDTEGVDELYRVPIDGGSAAKLNPALNTGGEVTDFTISPGGLRTVFIADVIDETFELFSVPTSGAQTAIKLNSSSILIGDRDVSLYRISPDSTRVIYMADQEIDDVRELFSVPISGGSPIKLSSSLVPGGDVGFFKISPTNNRVVYNADQDIDEVNEVYSVLIAGGGVSKLNSALGASRRVTDYIVSPDGSRVIYRADQNFDEVYELYSARIDGAASAIKLNPTPVLNGDIDSRIGSFRVSDDSARVVYAADLDIDTVLELYSVPVAGGANIKLNGPMVDGGDIWSNTRRSIAITPDSQYVFYIADQDTEGSLEIYRAPIAGGVVEKVNAPLPFGGSVGSLKLSADQQRLIYSADQNVFGERELFGVELTSEDDEFCFPIKAGNNGKFAVVCL